MGHESSWSGRGITWRHKDGEAKKAQQPADELCCEAWNCRMRLLGGPVQPSPSLRAAINGGFPFLRAECNTCWQHASVDLTEVRRPASTWVWQIEASLLCQHCGAARGLPRVRRSKCCAGLILRWARRRISRGRQRRRAAKRSMLASPAAAKAPLLGSPGIGGLVSKYLLPDELKPVYGSDPTSGMVFMRLKVI